MATTNDPESLRLKTENKVIFVVATVAAWLVLLLSASFLRFVFTNGHTEFGLLPPLWWTLLCLVFAILYGRSAARPISPEELAENRKSVAAWKEGQRRLAEEEASRPRMVYCCPYCMMEVHRDATLCPYCRSALL